MPGAVRTGSGLGLAPPGVHLGGLPVYPTTSPKGLAFRRGNCPSGVSFIGMPGTWGFKTHALRGRALWDHGVKLATAAAQQRCPQPCMAAVRQPQNKRTSECCQPSTACTRDSGWKTQRERPWWGPKCSGPCFDKQAPQLQGSSKLAVGQHPLTMGAQVSPASCCAWKFFHIRFSTGLGLYSWRSNTCQHRRVARA